MKTQDYQGPSAALKQSEFLGVADFDTDRDTTVTIEKVIMFKGGKAKDGRSFDGASLILRGFDGRGLVVNADRRKTLVRLFGANVGGWWGKTVSLYIDPHVKFAGKVTGGVKIRDTLAEQTDQDAESLIGDDAQHDDSGRSDLIAGIMEPSLGKARKDAVAAMGLEIKSKADLDALTTEQLDELYKRATGAWQDESERF